MLSGLLHVHRRLWLIAGLLIAGLQCKYRCTQTDLRYRSAQSLDGRALLLTFLLSAPAQSNSFRMRSSFVRHSWSLLVNILFGAKLNASAYKSACCWRLVGCVSHLLQVSPNCVCWALSSNLLCSVRFVHIYEVAGWNFQILWAV